MKRKTLSTIFLLLAAIIWGCAFVAQDKASALISPFTINSVRFLIASIILIPLIIVVRKIKKQSFLESNSTDRKKIIIGGTLSGVALAIASNFQQFGIASYPNEAATSGRSGFITAMYVILVPLISLIVFRKRISLQLIIAIILSVIGLYLLCLSNGLTNLYLGDIIVLICALCFAIQILTVDHFVEVIDPIKLSSFSFLVCGIISSIMMFIFESPNINNILLAWKPILYLAIFSSGIAYTCQIIGQKYSDNPTIASILMSLESVFAAISGAILMGERFTSRELIGCIVMFIAIVIAQMPTNIYKNIFRKKHKNREEPKK